MNFNNHSKQETIEKLKNGELPIIIFGAATVGEVMYHACSSVGIKVECFCENNINKTKKTLCGIKVYSVQDVKIKYQDAIFLISAADIKDVVDQLQNLGYSKWYASSLLLRNFNTYQYQFNVPMDFVEYAIATCLLCHDSYLTPDKLFLRSVDIVITEHCSLRCKDCSNLMRYYKNPVSYETKELIKTIDRFCFIMDEINEFRVIGGEPLMNKDSHLIIKRLIDEPKVKKVTIYTNGTIVPREDQIAYLKNSKILFIITDYGKLSRNLDSLIKVLCENGIAYYVEKVEGWTDCAKIMKHNRKSEKQKEIFRNCCAKNTTTLLKRNLYRCPFSANASNLRAVPTFKEDHINIFDESININEMKTKIKKFFLVKDFLNTCDYCNGRSFDDPEIQPAIQVNKPIEYQEY